MKKKTIFIILLILFPLPIFADNRVNIECPNEYKKNDVIECIIMAESVYEVSAIDFKYSLSSNIELEEFNVDDIWQGTNENNEAMLYTDVNKIGIMNIGIIKLKILNNDEFQIKTDYLSFFDKNFEENIIVDNINVNNNEKKMETKKYDNKYGIIILIIVVFVLLIISFMIYKKRSEVK